MDHSEHPGQPQRPPASAHLLIDSLDRYDQNNLGGYADPNYYLVQYLDGADPPAVNFSIDRNQPVMNGYFTRVAITQIQLDYQLPTVLENFNSRLYMRYTQGATTTSVIVDISGGWFTPNTLATNLENAIKNGLAAAAVPNAAFTVDYNTISCSFDFNTNNADLFGFTLNPTGLDPIAQRQWLRAQRLVGLTQNQLLPIVANPAVSRLVANRAPTLIYTSYIDFISRNLTKYQRVKDTDTASVDPRSFIIARLYLVPPNTLQKLTPDDAFGSTPFTICVDYNTPKHIRWSPSEAIGQIDIQLLDEYGEELPWDTFFPTEFQLTMIATET